MGNKSQRQKERHAKKRLEKRKKLEQVRGLPTGFQPALAVPLGSNARHRQRLSEQVPRSWAGELPEDAAMFDDSVLSSLPPEMASQVSAVREALQDALESRGDEAVKRTSEIPRSSPLSEWRLFIRGLVDWLANNTEPASEAWKRLDPQRRPGRIATSMMLALRTDLEQISHPAANIEPVEVSPTLPWSKWDDQQLYHAKLLRRVRFDRAALRVAEAGLSKPEESQELLLGPAKIQWLQLFIKEYGDTEPELVAALSHTGLCKAFAQGFTNLFDVAVNSFAGPRHDPRNRLLTYFFYNDCDEGISRKGTADRTLDQYLNQELPQNEALSRPLRQAIASQIHLCEAKALLTPNPGGDFMSRFFFEPTEDPKPIRMHLRAAIKSDPSNLPAYKEYREWLDSNLDEDRLTQAKRKTLEKELLELMESWAKGRPEDVEPRLWLVDDLLENERLEEARPHVDFLAGYRLDNPRARATPWKWQLLEAMRLCRRKAWLANVPARLDEAENIWPSWLSKQWLPYLKAALSLRSEQAEAYETRRQQICEASGIVRDSLPDACLMLGAAQRMRVPAEQLKRLREPLDQTLKNLDALSLEELMDTGAFFWDLHRAQLFYPAYRLHGANIGKELVRRLLTSTKLVVDGMNDDRVQKSVLWASEYRFWSNGYQSRKIPFFSNPDILRHPKFVAARVNAFLHQRYAWGGESYQDAGTLLREAAQSERDAYYRHWFHSLAEELDEKASKAMARFSRFPFGNLFGRDTSNDDEGNEDDDMDFDPDCNCAECQAARRAYNKGRSSENATPF